MDVFGNLVSKVFQASAKTILDDYLRRQANEAHEEICEELRNARITIDEAVERDSAIAMIHRISRAIQEGMAREKFKLLSRMLVSELPLGRRGSDEFNQFANIVDTLSYEELAFLAALHRIDTQSRSRHSTPHEAHIETTHRLVAELVGSGKLFENEEDYEATGIALGRTGFAIPVQTTPTSFSKTPKLDRFVAVSGLDEFAEKMIQQSRKNG